MIAFDSAKVRFSGSLSCCGPDLRRLGDVTPEPGAANSVFGSPVFRDVEGKWRMYYIAENPTGENEPGQVARYAESDDGIHWRYREKLVFEGLSDGAVIRHISILRPSADDPEWKLFGWVFDFDRGFVRYVCCGSGDGIRWKCRNFDRPCLVHPVDVGAGGKAGSQGLVPRSVNSPDAIRNLSAEEMVRRRRLLSNDATSTYRLPEGGFETFSVWLAENPAGGPNRTEFDNAPKFFRLIQRRTSRDGIEWSLPELVIPFDAEGPYQLQYYYLNGVTRSGSWRLGMLGRYPCDRQVIEPELIVSRDGRYWERPWKQPFLRLEDEGEGAGLIHTAHHLVDCTDVWRVYYSVSYYLHNNRFLEHPLPRRREIRAAEIPKGRLLGVSGTGVVEAGPFLFTDGAAAIDADIRGNLRCELADLNGNALPGRSFAESIPVAGNSTTHQLRWNNSRADRIACEMLTLRIRMEDGIFYRLTP